MLNSDDRRAIEGLFDRVADVERQNPHRDYDAERLIADSIRRQPNAPYYLAQTVVVQQQALEVAEQRIRELEGQTRGREVQDGHRRDVPRGPWDRNNDQQQDDRNDRRGSFGGGGFLAGAAQTAMGVAGGMMLGSMIGGLFGAGSANAAEGGNDSQQDNNADNGQDNGNDGGNDAGGDAGDFGGGDFDMGGDF